MGALLSQCSRLECSRIAVNSREFPCGCAASCNVTSGYKSGTNRTGDKKGAWMQSYCNQFRWLVAVFASEVFFRNRNRWNVSGGYHVER